VFLKKGDVMTLGIEGLGEQRQVVVPFKLVRCTRVSKPRPPLSRRPWAWPPRSAWKA
jgi:hypothetical protein